MATLYGCHGNEYTEITEVASTIILNNFIVRVLPLLNVRISGEISKNYVWQKSGN